MKVRYLINKTKLNTPLKSGWLSGHEGIYNETQLAFSLSLSLKKNYKNTEKNMLNYFKVPFQS